MHIVKLEERKAAKEAKFDQEMKDRIRKAILANKIQAEAPKWFEELRSKGNVK